MAKLKMANLFTLFLLLSVTGEVDVGRMRSCRDDNWHGFNCEIETACYEHFYVRWVGYRTVQIAIRDDGRGSSGRGLPVEGCEVPMSRVLRRERGVPPAKTLRRSCQ
ncbi:uncharacterized protein DS421_19g638280 [Arachis hypogaea]|uniref:Uncharacterized protein n=1 Tax=Arachis hypogaea TaxID=3818 RepID=A0A6B9V448_ARAHY|nr:uncharacterized protein DS421_19g638280 [Arachis hypogaea]